MLDILSMHAGDLGSTATYGKRRLCYIPASREHPEYDGRDGNLTLVMQPAQTGWGRKIEVDTYLVQEQQPIIGVPGRVFLLVNATDPDAEQPYQVVVGPNPQCTCKAGKCHTETDKHVDALTHLIQEGVI